MNLRHVLPVISVLAASNAAFCADSGCGKPVDCTVDSSPWVNTGPSHFMHPVNLPAGR
jgi:hypothetical protein